VFPLFWLLLKTFSLNSNHLKVLPENLPDSSIFKLEIDSQRISWSMTIMSGFLLPYHIVPLLLLGQFASCQVHVAILSKPPVAAVYVSPSFVSLSIEQDRWTEWVGTTSRNDFFFNTLDNLRQLTGTPPQLRIGANSGDRTDFGDNVQVLCYLRVK
jgi:hypothetical protein